ncbi:MAG: type I polyketide synthase [Gordonia sp. (in: high G+C Gram-positive bacteria)]
MKTTYNRISGMNPTQRGALSEQFDKAARISGAEPIAVIGIGCRLPGGVHGPQDYWSLLTSGRDAVVEVPADRWDAEEYYDPDPMAPGRMPSKWGGFLSDISGFDADFFGITPREAQAMDPQQRILLEVAWEGLHNAGYSPENLSGVRASVMIGVYYNEYQNNTVADRETIDAYSATGNAHSVTVGRIAYLLGLRGPAVAVDTACSSSLVSLHLACQSLRSRETDLGVAGGVNLIQRPETQLALGKWGMLSPRGHCNAFDVAADGFVRGEGAGVVILKRLTDAVRDGDRVVAVIRGSATNQDGRSNGLTAPNAPAQKDVIARALAAGDVPASSINFVETHGTGTALGDPIEFDALASVYGKGNAPCALGAVKSNFGHLEAAAGIAGFIKAVLAVQHGKIPPNLHFTQWNPAIDPKPTRLFVPTEATDWPVSDLPRRAAVSSFGLGGTNAHIVIEQGPDTAATADPAGVTTLFLSGKSAERIGAWAGVLAQWLDTEPGVSLTDVAHTLDRQRGRADLVASVSARTRAEAVAGLRALASTTPTVGVLPAARRTRGSGVVFCYSGQGSQWAGMGRRLIAEEPAFAAAIDALEPDFVAQAGFSLRDTLTSGDPITGIDRIQPVLVGVQLALTALWRSYGVEPDAVIGHSMGEVAAAVVSGALTQAEGLKVIATRSKLMAQRLSGQGAMALLETDAATTEALVRNYDDVSLAVYASPKHSVVAGPPEAIDKVIADVTARNLLARRVEVDVASHHRTVDPILDDLRAALSDLAPLAPTISLLSTVARDGESTEVNADYWVRNLRQPVRFTQTVAAAAQSYSTFIEVSPHPLLTHSISDTLAAAHPRADVAVLGTGTRNEDETLVFHANLAAASASRDTTVAARGGALIDLPPTSWQHVRYWATVKKQTQVAGTHPFLGAHVELPAGAGHIWQSDIGAEDFPWLADHKVHGQAILPAAGFAEIVLAAGAQALARGIEGLVLTQVEVEQMLPVEQTVRVTTQLTVLEEGGARVEIHSRSDDGVWRRHAVGRVAPAVDEPVPPAIPVSGAVLPAGDFYSALRRTGAHHGRSFAALTRIVRGDGGVSEAEIVLPDEATANRSFGLHPVLLDAALQGVAAAMPVAALADDAEATYLPVAINQLRVLGPVGRTATCFARVIDAENGSDKLGSFVLTDPNGRPIVVASQVYLRRVQSHTVPLPLEQKLFATEWVTSALGAEPDAVVPAGSWLVLGAFADGRPTDVLATDFATALGGGQRRVITADISDESALSAGFAEATSDPAYPPAGVIVLVDKQRFDASSATATAARDLVWSVSATVRTVVSGWHGTPPRLWLVARDGLSVDPREPGNPAVGALKGLVRVLAYEHPDLRATLVDLDDAGDTMAELARELGAGSRDDIVAWRDGTRYVERLTRTALDVASDTPKVTAEGAYILTGGLGGLGLVMARWLVAGGAGRVVLNGRSAPNDAQQAALTELAAAGDVVYVRGDITTPGVVTELITNAEQTGKTLRGVLHSAAVIDDALISAMSADSLDRVWGPKVSGAVELNAATAQRDLDWWIVFSSVASLLGSPGQGAYAAANAWVDALVAWRRAEGLPATSINWGQWAQVGIAQTLSMTAIDPITPEEGIEALETLLQHDIAQAGVVRLRLDRVSAAFPELSQLGYFAALMAELNLSAEADDWTGVDPLRELDGPAVLDAVTERLRSRIAAIMGYADNSAVDPGTPLTELGMDSLMAVRIRNTVRGDFGAEPPVALLLQGATPRDLAVDLIKQLGLAQDENSDSSGGLRDRAQQRAAARQRAQRRRTGQRV